MMLSLLRRTLVTAFAMPPSAAIAKTRDEYPVKGVDGLPWTTVLSSGQYFILRQGGTEPPNSSPLLNEKRRGVYVCAGCASPLFDSTQKFDSGTGWPSYASPRRAATETLSSFAGLLGGEVRCVSCGGHLGDVFRDGQKFPGTPAAVSGLRYCIDGAALVFIPSDADAGPIAGDGLTNLRTARLLPQPKRSSAITMQVAPDDISSVPALASRVAAMLAAAMIFAQAPLLSSLPSALSQACTEGTKAEINGDLELSPCLLLRWRVVTSRLFPPLLLEQSGERAMSDEAAKEAKRAEVAAKVAALRAEQAKAKEEAPAPLDKEYYGTHSAITCDGCGVEPIEGYRYRCSKCANHDLCEMCWTSWKGGNLPYAEKQKLSSDPADHDFSRFKSEGFKRLLSSDGAAGLTEKKAAKVKPNDPCPCGSGKKYKKCCGKNA